MPATWLRNDDPLDGSVSRLTVATTSSAVIGLPVWNVTPLRSANVHSEGELAVHEVASRGWRTLFTSGQHRYSPASSTAWILPSSYIVTGSGEPVATWVPNRPCPPRFGAPEGPPPELPVEGAPDPEDEPHAASTPMTGAARPITAARRRTSLLLIRPERASS